MTNTEMLHGIITGYNHVDHRCPACGFEWREREMFVDYPEPDLTPLASKDDPDLNTDISPVDIASGQTSPETPAPDNGQGVGACSQVPAKPAEDVRNSADPGAPLAT
jgi:hypothetical protein